MNWRRILLNIAAFFIASIISLFWLSFVESISIFISLSIATILVSILEYFIKPYYLFTDKEAKTDHNAKVVSYFMEHCKEEGFELPDTLFESYFDA